MSFTQFVTQLGAAGSSEQEYYWINLAGSSNGLVGTGAGGLSDGQAGATAWMPSGNASTTYTLHFDNQGNIVGSRRNTSTSGPSNFSMPSFDETNSRMVVSGQVSPSVFESGICAMPIDGSTTNFSDSIGESSKPYTPYSNHVDASGNIYVFGGRDADPSYSRLRLDYWDSSGTYQGGRRGSSSFSSRCFNGTTDSSGNVYTISYAFDTYGGNVLHQIEMMKFNSSFSQQWGVRLLDTTQSLMTSSFLTGSISVTSSGDTVNGTVRFAGGKSYTTQLNGSTGAYVKSYYTGANSANTYYPNAYNDTGDGWVYTIQNESSRASVNVFSSSLARQGQYTIAWTGAASSGNYIVGVRGGPNDSLYITGVVKGLPSTTTTDWKMFTIKLPKDGSVTGTFSVGSEEVTIGWGTAYRTTTQLHNTTYTPSWGGSSSTDLGSWGFSAFSTTNYTESVAQIP